MKRYLQDFLVIILIGLVVAHLYVRYPIWSHPKLPPPSQQIVLVAFHLQTHFNAARKPYDVPDLKMQAFKSMTTCQQALADLKPRLTFGKCYVDTDTSNPGYTFP